MPIEELLRMIVALFCIGGWALLALYIVKSLSND